ncbi:MAG: Bpu10I family restriction endonuclease [Acidobacteria bacterium]|nr:Bpu10I family restriction endonuclease [Acidobacteriota bacterium]
MANALQELARVLRPDGRAVVILGHESRVLGAPFYNADIVERIACGSEMFDIVLQQQRVFTNRFGESIREDILNLRREAYRNGDQLAKVLGRSVAVEALNSALATVPTSNHPLLIDAISRINEITGTPVFNSLSYAHYQTREKVMMVKEKKEQLMSNDALALATPHLDKLDALLKNLRLPAADKPRVQEALQRYHEWIKFLDMTPVSIISTQIDDALIVSKAKRMSSNIRQEYRSAEERRRHRDEYVKFLNSSRYYADVFQRMIDKIQRVVDDTDPDVDKVLKQGHF